MVVDVGVEVKGGVLQYPLREEDTMKHDAPVVEYNGESEVLPRRTIGEHGLLGRIYKVLISEQGEPVLAQLVEGNEHAEGTVLIDPLDGVAWNTGVSLDDVVILKRYNARLVLTEVL